MAGHPQFTADVLTTNSMAVEVLDEKRPSVSIYPDEKHVSVQATAINHAVGPIDPDLGDVEIFGKVPTEEELLTLRKVAGSVPNIAYLLCAVEFAERASYYGCSRVFSNFVEFPLPKGGNGAGAPPRGTQETAGALNRGLATSSAMTLLFQFLAFTIPILGGWLADVKYGRYTMICVGVVVAGIGHIIMVFGALPSVLQAGHGMAPFAISLIILAFGAGLFKSNIAPTVIDQYPHQRPLIQTLKTGERVIVDPEATVQRMMLTFYGLVNVGAFFGVATSYAEKDVGYWLAYLLPGIVYFLMPIVLVFAYKRTIKKPPSGNDLGKVIKIISMAIKKNGIWKFGRSGFLDAAKPTVLAAEGVTTFRNKPIDWTDAFVQDVGRTFVACQIFIFYPVYNLNDGGIGNIQTSMGSAMTTNGAPNDLINNFNPLTIIVAVPILTYLIYPFLRKHNINFGRIKRITFGFMLAAVASAIGAILQWRVYKTSPCGYYATSCDDGTGVSPISVWAETPMWVLQAVSECFVNVTAYEVAYARSPKNMKGLVMALFLFTTAISAAISEACVDVLVDPHLIWPFVATAVAGLLSAVIFYCWFRKIDDEEFMTEEQAVELEREEVQELKVAKV
ncbi:MAG: hypothetical protein M1819_003429 [Sarea resinae]|nr:MAG: hypothetical protein M1819_003429 [Sarea resinae]